MKIEVCVPETWTTVNLDFEELFHAIELSIEDSPETVNGIMNIINRYHCFLAKVPDRFIEDMTPEVKKVIADALRKQACRFDPDFDYYEYIPGGIDK